MRSEGYSIVIVCRRSVVQDGAETDDHAERCGFGSLCSFPIAVCLYFEGLFVNDPPV